MDNFHKNCPPRMEDGRFLTDYRQANTRELFRMSTNGITRDDEHRMFYQQKGGEIMDREWKTLRNGSSCFTNCCLHQNPTRSTPGMNHTEMQNYNKVRKSGQSCIPNNACDKLNDYRMSQTNDPMW
jgi:hypothetical protein